MSEVNEGKLGAYRRRLIEERSRLVRSIDRNRAAAGDIRLDHTEDEVDLAVISHDRELLYNLNESDREWLKSIQQATERIDRDEYGECLNCEEDIDERRLTAVPWVELCIRCQEQKELDRLPERFSSAAGEPELPEF